MKRIFAMLLCLSLLLTGCFGGTGAEEKPGLSGLLDTIQDGIAGKDKPYQAGPEETVPGVPEHISSWADPLEGIPEPTYYAVDEEMAWAMSLIGMELTPPEVNDTISIFFFRCNETAENFV